MNEQQTLSKTAQKLVQDHLGLVEALAREIIVTLPPGVELAELVSLGRGGLINAATRYDPRRNVAFATYATYRIRGAILDGLRKNMPLQRPALQRLRYQERANELLEQHSEEPTKALEEEIAALEDMVADVTAVYLTSFDAAQEHGEEFAAEEPTPDERIRERQTFEQLRRARQTMDPKEEEFLRLHYDEDLPLSEIGKRLGISKAWASRLHTKAIRSLAEAFEAAAPPEEASL